MSAELIEKTLKIAGMSCPKCVKRVSKILAEDGTVENIQVDLDGGSATFNCQNDTDIPALIVALKEYDFSATE
ncbi:MAG: heavy-metal-associated domain-containing protein [Gammaproteobacteria bacterium]|nr:heavy-metal-associated domain-containing protein [Gammaproteobacteria bacterium]